LSYAAELSVRWQYCYILPVITDYTDKKYTKIFLIFKEIQMGAVAKSNMRKGFLIYQEMRQWDTGEASPPTAPTVSAPPEVGD
jgi:hypothetical protein